jgi:hypothetical protein
MMNTIAMILMILALEMFLIVQVLRVTKWIALRLIRLEEKWRRKGGEEKRILLILRRVLLDPL